MKPPEGAAVILPQDQGCPSPTSYMPWTPKLGLLHMYPHFRPQVHSPSTCIYISGTRVTTALCWPAPQAPELLLHKKHPHSIPGSTAAPQGPTLQAPVPPLSQRHLQADLPQRRFTQPQHLHWDKRKSGAPQQTLT